jgi:hypothetical protein
VLIKPVPGRVVRDPVSMRPVPEGGREVPESAYWLRRLAAGDVVLTDQIPDSEVTQ